jgi:hypothetical protein
MIHQFEAWILILLKELFVLDDLLIENFDKIKSNPLWTAFRYKSLKSSKVINRIYDFF